MPKKKVKVTRVIDGDTFMTDGFNRSVRLANVNAPERNTTAGKKAKKSLQSMIGGKTVEVDVKAKGSYGRNIADVKIGSKSVNQAVKRTSPRPAAKRPKAKRPATKPSQRRTRPKIPRR